MSHARDGPPSGARAESLPRSCSSLRATVPAFPPRSAPSWSRWSTRSWSRPGSATACCLARDALERFRLDLELARFDLEATRREREALGAADERTEVG